jgi:hypothetical protein
LNIAVLSGTDFSEDFPQVGRVDFTQDPDGELTGATDQGCTWQFGSGLASCRWLPRGKPASTLQSIRNFLVS